MTTNRPNAADKLREALRIIHGLTAGTGCTWLVGGSTGLMLQGVSLAALPRDLDLYADRTDALDIHCKLSAYAVDGPDPERRRFIPLAAEPLRDCRSAGGARRRF